MLNEFAEMEVWFVTGSQNLYGPETLREVERNAIQIVEGLNGSGRLPVRLVAKPVVTTPEAISAVCQEANASGRCIALVFWMHTFSPAKMWIAGLRSLSKPYAHLHTQFNRDIPWATIDMDFMNLNQAAHGDREFGFICTRLRQSRKIIAGHWEAARVSTQLASWMRVAAAWHDAQNMKVARLGDNMRNVAVTEGDKVEAQIRLGYSVNGYGIGELARRLEGIGGGEVERLCAEYEEQYEMAPALRCGGPRRGELAEAARIELALRSFLQDGGFKAFTDTFESLDGLRQLPGLAVQRLMADGYGFGAEGDWKQAALVRSLKVMGAGLDGGADLYGRLHVPSSSLRRAGAGCAHAGDLSDDRGRQTHLRGPPVGNRRQRGPGSAGLHGPAGAGDQRHGGRLGRSLPHGGQPARSRHARTRVAEAAGCQGGVAAASQSGNRRSRLDSRRRCSPHGLQQRSHRRTNGGFCGNGGRGVRGDRPARQRLDGQTGDALELRLLPAGGRDVSGG